MLIMKAGTTLLLVLCLYTSFAQNARVILPPPTYLRDVFTTPLQSKPHRSEAHTSALQSHRDLHSCPTRRSSDLVLCLYTSFAQNARVILPPPTYLRDVFTTPLQSKPH